ncbi:MAG TPA: transglutaminaseTgpA domain-containing protein [Nocardioides sp.]|nr:transglutaminaseTgpA domain-containing protein [Nocardioides sp.]
MSSTARPTLGAALLTSLVAAATTWAALTAWRGFVTVPGSYLERLAVVAVAVGLLGAVLRWRGVPRLAVTLAQTAVAGAIVSFQVTGSPLPVGGTGVELADALSTAVETARTYVAPISTGVPAVWPLLVVSGAFFVVVVDTVACTFRRVAGAGLALLAIYSVPSGLLDDGPGVGSFVLATAGFLVLLHLEARDQLHRWGRSVDGAADDEPTGWGHAHPVREAARAGAGRIGITATALALVVPTFVPVLGVDLLELGNGSGDGDIRIRKPITDMRRDLERDIDDPLINIATDDPAPGYLRVAVLNRFTGQEWSSGDRDVASSDTASGALPPPPGLADSVPRAEYDYRVRISDGFDSTWLPTQFPASAVQAEGDWRFDPRTMDFLAADDDLDTRNASYTMTAVEPDYGTDGRYFRDAPRGEVSEEFLDLPSTGIPNLVRDLARSVTSRARNDYEQALVLQRWFRQDGGFEYSVDRAPAGTGNGTLETFLARSGRVGYCEQFASAMAVMARVLGIPARVAVGFLAPTRLRDGTWEYSSHDLHAWPELYFAGAGWVRFEPTPSARAEDAPDYSTVPVAGVGVDDPANPSTASSAAGGTETVAPSTRPSRPAEETDGASADGERAGRAGGIAWAVGIALLVLALAALAVLGPRSLRSQARRSRLAGDDPDSVWRELRAVATDLGVPWPDGRSPREVGVMLLPHLADPDAPPVERPRTGPDVAPVAADALERLVLAVERTRYARPGSVATLERTTAAADAELVAAALAAGVTPRARRRAQWLPRSVWRR